MFPSYPPSPADVATTIACVMPPGEQHVFVTWPVLNIVGVTGYNQSRSVRQMVATLIEWLSSRGLHILGCGMSPRTGEAWAIQACPRDLSAEFLDGQASHPDWDGFTMFKIEQEVKAEIDRMWPKVKVAILAEEGSQMATTR